MLLTQADRLLYSTIKINSFLNEKIISRGTGFFFNFKIEERIFVPCIITNKHVISGADKLRAIFHTSKNVDIVGPTGEFVEVDMNIGHEKPAFFLEDENIDICALPVNEVIIHSISINKPIFFVPVTSDIVPTEDQWLEFDSIEDITMVGYPRGISDETNNLPVVRRYNCDVNSKKI